MYHVCLRARGVGLAGRNVFFQRSCCESGDVAGCWGMLVALGSAEPAGHSHGLGLGALPQPPCSTAG